MGGCLCKDETLRPRIIKVENIPGIGQEMAPLLNIRGFLYPCEVWAAFETRRQSAADNKDFAHWLLKMNPDMSAYRIEKCIEFLKSVSDTIEDNYIRLQIAQLIYKDQSAYDYPIKNTVKFLENYNQSYEKINYSTLYNHACDYITNELADLLEVY